MSVVRLSIAVAGAIVYWFACQGCNGVAQHVVSRLEELIR